MKLFNSILLAISVSPMLLLINSCNDQPEEELTENTIYEVKYGDDPLQKFDFYLPAGRDENTRILVFIHGDGWNAGDKSDYSMQLSHLQGQGFAIANVDYRLANNIAGIHFPDLLSDIQSMVSFLITDADKFDLTPDHIILAGHGSGANLALYASYYINSDNWVKAAISLGGQTDITDDYFINTPELNAQLQNLTGSTFVSDSAYWSYISPVTWVTSSTVPTLLQYAANDTIAPPEQGEILDAALSESGVEHNYIVYPAYDHNFGTLENGGYYASDVEQAIIDFVNAH